MESIKTFHCLLTSNGLDSVLRVLNGINLKASLLAEQIDVNNGFIVTIMQEALKPAPNTELLQVLQLLLAVNNNHLEHF